MSDNRRIRKKQDRADFSENLPLIRRGFAILANMLPDILMLGILSLLLLWGYDVLSHTEYFLAEDMEIIGIRKLSPKDLLKNAGLDRGTNLLTMNPELARDKLLSNPWIAEAEVRRNFPSGLRITVKEHEPLAVLDMGRKFVLNAEGTIFKEWTPSDPQQMPVITGLGFSDVRVSEEPGSDCFAAVMEILRLGSLPKSLMPNHTIKRIHADRELGITVYPTERIREIKLGYGKYADKYGKLESIFRYFRENRNIRIIDSIDLHNTERIVVNPIGAESLSGNDKEVRSAGTG